MKLYNPYTNGCIEYPLNIDLNVLNYYIQHETPFTDRHSEWAVSVLENGDMVYLPYGNNRCYDVYIVTRLYINDPSCFPYGIYKAPINSFYGV